MTRIVTAPLLAAAYPKHERKFLTHAAELDDSGMPITVLCDKVRAEHITDDTTQHTDALPTCKSCAAKLAKRR